VTSSGVPNLEDLEGGSVKHVRHYQVYRGMSPTTSSRLEVRVHERSVDLPVSVVDSRHILCSLLLSKTAVNCNVASASVSVHYNVVLWRFISLFLT